MTFSAKVSNKALRKRLEICEMGDSENVEEKVGAYREEYFSP